MVLRSLEPKKIFDYSLHVIINILILYIIVVLVIGLFHTILSVSVLFEGAGVGHAAFSQTVTDILTFLVIIELFKGFVEYFRDKRFRLHSMMDPSIVFVIREMIVTLYEYENVSWQNLSGFALLIVSMGGVRTLAVRFSPGDEK